MSGALVFITYFQKELVKWNIGGLHAAALLLDIAAFIPTDNRVKFLWWLLAKSQAAHW
jgi:hypothetical protein